MGFKERPYGPHQGRHGQGRDKIRKKRSGPEKITVTGGSVAAEPTRSWRHGWGLGSAELEAIEITGLGLGEAQKLFKERCREAK